MTQARAEALVFIVRYAGQIEVACPTRRGGRPVKPGYRWANGYTVVLPNGNTTHPWTLRRDAIATANQWAKKEGGKVIIERTYAN